MSATTTPDQTRRRWTHAEKRKLREAHLAGQPDETICAMLGRPLQATKKMRSMLGLRLGGAPPRNGKHTKATREAANEGHYTIRVAGPKLSCETQVDHDTALAVLGLLLQQTGGGA